MTKWLILCFLLFLLHGCGRDETTPVDSLDFLPENSVALIQINNFSAFLSDLKNNGILNAWEAQPAYKKVATTLANLQYVQSNAQGQIAFYPTENDSLHYVLVAPESPDLFNPENISNLVKETIITGGITIEKFSIDGRTTFSTKSEGHIILSSSDSLLRIASSLPEGFDGEPGFKLLHQTANSGKNATFYVKLSAAPILFNSLLQPEARQNLMKFSEWTTLDLGSRQDYLGLSGIALPTDSLPNYLNLLKDMDPLRLRTASFAPASADAILGVALNGPVYAGNKLNYTGAAMEKDSLFMNVEEVGLIHDSQGKLLLIATLGGESLQNYVSEIQNGTVNYQEHDIHSLPEDSFLGDFLEPLLGDFTPAYHTVLENALIFSENLEALQHLITQYTLGNTFETTALYEAAKSSLADESNLLLVANKKGVQSMLRASLEEETYTSFSESRMSDYVFSAQLVAEASFFHTGLIARKIGETITESGVSKLFSVQLDAPVASNPQFVKNHRTNKMEVVVQDEANSLYLISTEGQVLWKKPLQAPIQGKISQVDLYKNGRLQLAFTTDNQFIVLDRNGKEVAPFKINYEGGNLNPLAVFDYENNRNYRFVVTQGEKIFMYNNQGKIVKGFTFTNAGSPILSAPQHLRFGNRDYLVFRLANGELKILNRVGQTRVKVGETIDFSENQVYAFNDRFALTDKTGTLLLIDEKGNIEKTSYGLKPDHGMEATTKTMALMDENVLSIKDKEVTLDYGVYTTPRIFYIHDVIYVGVTDIQSQKSFLFNSSGELVPGFPVTGKSQADLSDMEGDRKPELVVETTDDTLVVYRLN